MTADVPIVLLLIVLILLGCGVVMTREDRRLLRRDVRAVHRWTRRELAKPRLRLRIASSSNGRTAASGAANAGSSPADAATPTRISVQLSTTERDRRAHLNAIVRGRQA